MKVNISAQELQKMTLAEYAIKIKVYLNKAKDKGLKKLSCVMISDFEFACGTKQTFTYYSSESEVNKFFKEVKKERKKEKDFSKGVCKLNVDEKNNLELEFAIKGVGKPAAMKKNGKKVFKRLGVTLKDVIKGAFVEDVNEITTDIEEENETATDIENIQGKELQEQAEELKKKDDIANDTKELTTVAKEFAAANSKMQKEVISKIKLSKKELVVYTKEHIQIAEQAFRATASFIDKYDELVESSKNIQKKAPKLAAIKDSIVKNDLVKKYEMIWKKVIKEEQKQKGQLTGEQQVTFQELDRLFSELEKSLS